MALNFNVGMETRSRLAPDLGISATTTITPPAVGIHGNYSLAPSAGLPLHTRCGATPDMSRLFHSPNDDSGGSNDMSQFIATIGNFSITGDVASLETLERIAEGKGAAAAYAQEALTKGIQDFSLLASKALRDAGALTALMRVYRRYHNPAAVKALIDAGLPIDASIIPAAATLVSAGTGRESLRAFEAIYQKAIAPTGTEGREEAISALRAATLDEKGWRALAEQEGVQDIAVATPYWEALGLMGMVYGNVSARRALGTANLAPYAQDKTLKLTTNADITRILWSAIACAWGNRTIDRDHHHILGKISAAINYLTDSYPNAAPALGFDEKAYQRDLKRQSVPPQKQRIHDALVCLAQAPRLSDEYVQFIENHFDEAAQYILLLSTIASSLSGGGPVATRHEWIEKTVTRIVGDATLAARREGFTLATMFAVNNQLPPSFILKFVASKFRENPDHLMRLLIFLFRNQEDLTLTEEGLRFIFNEGFAQLEDEAVISVLSGLLAEDQLIAVAALHHFRKFLPKLDMIFRMKKPSLCLDPDFYDANAEAIYLIETSFRTAELNPREGQFFPDEFNNPLAWNIAVTGFRYQQAGHPDVPSIDDPKFLPFFMRRRDVAQRSAKVNKDEMNVSYMIHGLQVLLSTAFEGAGFSEHDIFDMLEERTDDRILDTNGDRLRQIKKEMLRELAGKISGRKPGTSPSSLELS